jgi:SynChlorMet cassette protein ScmC
MQTIRKSPVHADIVTEYLLRLGNGQAWQLTSTVGAKSEVVELARVMGLRTGKSNGYPRLIFIGERREQTECEETPYGPSKNIEEDLRRSGWQAHDLRVLRIWYHNDTADLICEMRDNEDVYEKTILSMRLALYPIYQQVLDTGGLPLHAGLVGHQGKGVLLAAPRSMGKSTSCRRLPPSWLSLCDEEALIVRHAERRYLVHPLPTWSEYFEKRSNQTWKVNDHLPLTSIFLLEKSTVDEVIPLGQGEATAFVSQLALQMCYRYWADLGPPEMRSRRTQLLENICELAGAVPVFKLGVSLNGRFWEKIETVLP